MVLQPQIRPQRKRDAELLSTSGQAESQVPGNLLDRIAASSTVELPLPRALLVFAHPDDEVIAVGGRLERFRESRLICVTDGAPRDGLDARCKGFSSLHAYSSARFAELNCALLHAGLNPNSFLCKLNLGSGARPIADQEAAWRLAEIALALAAELKSFRPDAVLTHPYEGGHPDHDACAFAVHAASQLVASPFDIIEAPFYHTAESGIETGRFLANGCAPIICHLSATEKESKRKRLVCFASQAETLRPFGIDEEQYRFAPNYDFTQPPHPGRLFYENFSWGITGAQFRELAGAALNTLRIEQPFERRQRCVT